MAYPDESSIGSTPEVGAIPPAVLRVLLEFSSALGKHTMYPEGHPVLLPVAEQFLQQLSVPFGESKRFTIHVARDRLEVDGVATDPSNHLLKSLAARLHSHHLISLTFVRGIQSDEASGLLEALAREVDRGEEPLGLAPDEELKRWSHIKIRPLLYDPLSLGAGETGREDEAGDELWKHLAPPPFTTDVAGIDLLKKEPQAVADAIEESIGEDAVDRSIAVEIFRLAEDLKDASGEVAEVLFGRMSQLIFSLEPDTLKYLLQLGDEGDRTNQFLRNSSEWMESDAIIELVRTVGENRGDGIAPWLIRLTSKLTSYAAPKTAGTHDSESDSAIRSIVQRLLEDWELEDPRPADYTEELTRHTTSPSAGPDGGKKQESLVEPARMVSMSIDLDEPNELARWAAGRLVSRGEAATLLDLLEQAPDDSRVAPGLWRGISTPRAMRQLLEVERPNFEVLDRIISHLGLSGAESMLDILARSKLRSVRRYLFNQISKMGPEVGPYIVKLLGDSRWYVVRNMLGLLSALKIWPEDFDIAPYLNHKEARVRVEASRLGVTREDERDRSICVALEDEDERVVRLGLAEAAESCPLAAEPILVRYLRQQKTPEGLRVQAVRALGTRESRRALKAIAKACLRPRWVFWRQLAHESTVLLEGVSLLARQWPVERAAKIVLRLVAKSGDSDLRWAAAGERPGVMSEAGGPRHAGVG